MYIPKAFNLEDKELIKKIIKDFPFATLISNNSEGIQISHLPLIINKDSNTLIGHFAKANSQSENINNKNVIAIFHGPHTYISPTFYETQNAVPTWDYVNIHISGKIQLIDSKEELFNDLNSLISYFEPDSDKYSINSVEEVNKERLINGIIGFRIHIENIEAKSKLNQNHSIERQALVAEKLKLTGKENDNYISNLIRNNLKNLK